VLQGGDREHGDGSGGASIFSSKGEFPVELNQRLRFATRGLLATAAGPTGNSSQFFITLALNAPLERSKVQK
jgi:cyclophilin family peptidyl-prolyl cis-trans isomerase